MRPLKIDNAPPAFSRNATAEIAERQKEKAEAKQRAQAPPARAQAAAPQPQYVFSSSEPEPTQRASEPKPTGMICNECAGLRECVRCKNSLSRWLVILLSQRTLPFTSPPMTLSLLLLLLGTLPLPQISTLRVGSEAVVTRVDAFAVVACTITLSAKSAKDVRIRRIFGMVRVSDVFRCKRDQKHKRRLIEKKKKNSNWLICVFLN